MEKLSKTKARRIIRKFFKDNSITDRLQIKRIKRQGVPNTEWEVNGLVVIDPEASAAIDTLKDNFITAGKLTV